MSNIFIEKPNIENVYALLIDILLTAEGDNTHHLINNVHDNYEQTKKIHIPPVLLPLLYAASNSVQMAVAFLPYYLKENNAHNDAMRAFKHKIMRDTVWFTQEIYPEILKFLLSDTIRTIPDMSFVPQSCLKHEAGTKIMLYDSQMTAYPPFYGVNIYDLKNYNPENTYYLVGNVTPKALDILTDILKDNVVYGITPCVYHQDNWQAIVHKRLNYFANTVLAGSLNMQLPFIEHYFQAGIAPLSFYHLLYRTQSEQMIITNALCLLNNKPIMPTITDYIHYKRLIPHTDVHIYGIDIDDLTLVHNYLTILSVIA